MRCSATSGNGRREETHLIEFDYKRTDGFEEVIKTAGQRHEVWFFRAFCHRLWFFLAAVMVFAIPECTVKVNTGGKTHGFLP